MKKSIGIIGYGRFGKLLAELLSVDFAVKVYDIKTSKNSNNISFVDLDTLLQEKNIFVAVPIRDFEEVIRNISPKLQEGTTLFDVCSVKVYPVNIMQQYLPKNIDIIATHPLFGPDSLKIQLSGANPPKIMMYPVRDNYHCYNEWKKYFNDKTIEVIELTPDQHDRQAAFSQGITHFIGRALAEAGIQSTDINTLGFDNLLKIMQQTCSDSWELFLDLQQHNPYTKEMLQEFKAAAASLNAKISA